MIGDDDKILELKIQIQFNYFCLQFDDWIL